MESVSGYTSLLNPNDVIQLFNLLENALGSRAAAADACGITRKTAYDWKSVKDLKFDTKIKLLNILMEKLPEETLDYLTQKSVSSASDTLIVYLSAMYESIIDETKSESLIKKLELFDEKRNQYDGLITGKFDLEISDKIFHLKQKAKEHHLNWIPKPSSMMTVEQSCILVPIIIKEIISRKDVTDRLLSEELNVSEELIKAIRASLQQTLSLPDSISPDLRQKLEDVNKAITSITNPPITSSIQESSRGITTTGIESEIKRSK